MSEIPFEPWWIVAILPEILLVILAIFILILDLVLPVASRRNLGWVTAGGLGLKHGAVYRSEKGQKISFFGEGGGKRMADRLKVPFLGSVPRSERARRRRCGQTHRGARTESAAAQALNQVARQVAARISVINLEE